MATFGFCGSWFYFEGFGEDEGGKTVEWVFLVVSCPLHIEG